MEGLEGNEGEKGEAKEAVVEEVAAPVEVVAEPVKEEESEGYAAKLNLKSKESSIGKFVDT